LGELGYGFAYRVLDAQWCRTHRHPRAVPQRRRRVFVVGCFGNPTSAAKVLFERESLSRYSAPRRATRQATAANVEEGVGSGGDGGVPSSRGEHLVWPAQVASTLNASFGDKQGLEDQHALNGAPCFVPDVRATTVAIQGTAADVEEGIRGGDDFVAATFTARTGEARNNSDVSQYGTGGGNVPLVIPTLAYSIREDATNNTFSATPTDVGLTVTSLRPSPQSHHAQIFIAESEVTKQVHAQTMQVRRLTPTECERLQGFPDGWTKIPWKKKSADECPDGPRYKALGNSMAVNCMEWLGERIQAVESGTL